MVADRAEFTEPADLQGLAHPELFEAHFLADGLGGERHRLQVGNVLSIRGPVAKALRDREMILLWLV